MLFHKKTNHDSEQLTAGKLPKKDLTGDVEASNVPHGVVVRALTHLNTLVKEAVST